MKIELAVELSDKQAVIREVRKVLKRYFPLSWKIAVTETVITAEAYSSNKQFQITVRCTRPKDATKLCWMAQIRTKGSILAMSPNLLDIELEEAISTVHQQWNDHLNEVRSLLGDK